LKHLIRLHWIKILLATPVMSAGEMNDTKLISVTWRF